ncbi:basement membrane-specific heparan sulfate proteoglycan core protein isoform X5 [Rhinatrema bivittatum]|uniref:basement membrane-specific heparan sulfate proteoglycan core protein isoform X5 n=1 Tax=Rhinatrema bivittatum TaxID=194408 RepID=UPI00112E4B9D|nr:basement membrane-specific heparan sulfate proteoglycan core protein isoform X5 [Rhinatrema bivittatum]
MERLLGISLPLLLLAQLLQVAHASKVLDEVSFPDDTESDARPGKPRWGYTDLSDDEDLLADEASGDGEVQVGSADGGSGEPPLTEGTLASPTPLPEARPPATDFLSTPIAPLLAGMSVSEPDEDQFLIYYRALVNFTHTIDFSPALDDVTSEEFRDVSEAVVDTLESEYSKIPGEQLVSVVFVKEIDGNVFVELDVGSEGNSNDAQIREVLYSVIESGSIASYVTSTEGFQFRRLGSAESPPPSESTEISVPMDVRDCTASEFTCRDGGCVPLDYRCDRRPDCRDMSDEEECEVDGCGTDEFSCGSGECVPLVQLCDHRPDCVDQSDESNCVISTTPASVRTTTLPFTTRAATTVPAVSTSTRRIPSTTPYRRTTPKPLPDTEVRPCRRDEARCPNGQCIPRDYVCDGERDCRNGEDELNCGTPSPCEPNEMKCRNGRCTLKLWRCDGDDDCGDNSDESNCPTKGPGDTCAPDQFTCVTARTCIPASYQCDDEADCPDRTDEVGCHPPQVITPPEEAIVASRGQTVRFTCVAIGVPTPIITWRLNWGHIPTSNRVSLTSEGGHGTLTIRDVKEADQGAYTCEAINAKGMVFGIPDGVLVLKPSRGPCPEGQFHIQGTDRCIPCFCFGVSKTCQNTGRYRNQIHLRFDVPDDFKGVNVSVPSHPGTPPLSSNQLQIDPSAEEFQLVDLSRRFLSHDSFWTLPGQFLGNKVDSYGGFLSYKVQYVLARGQSEPVQKPDVIIVGNGQRLIYRVQVPTRPATVNQRRVHFTEENWQHESGAPASREDLLMALQNLESVLIQTVYNNRTASVGLSDIVMDTTTVEFTSLGVAHGVEECRCPAGYLGLSCETCAAKFERVPGGIYLGTCAGCRCNGHASSCDPVSGYCLNCQHNTEGPQCNKCKAGFFGDPSKGTSEACRPCPCPSTDYRRRFSDTCFLDIDGQATCDNCAPGYTGRRCERCAEGYEGNPVQPGGRCQKSVENLQKCDERGSRPPSSSTTSCLCKPNVAGNLCDECKSGAFYLSDKNPEGCLKCFCMGVTKQCASSYWNRHQVRASYSDRETTEFALSNLANTRTFSEGIGVRGQSELVFAAFSSVPRDNYFWVLPERFKGDKVTSYGGELRYTVTYTAPPGSQPLYGQPDVILQGNGIFLEYFADYNSIPGVPLAITVPFRESSWRRADGQEAIREHLLMALADINLFMIRATYSERMTESRILNINMDVAVPHSTGLERALEVEHCVCPAGYRGPSCQECDSGYTRSTSGLYLGTCVRCECGGHAAECDEETGECLNCQHNTEGSRCERCKPGYYGDARRGTSADCQPCPCRGPFSSSQPEGSCFMDTDGRPTCDSCATGYTGRQCERCAPGYVGDPSQGQPCRVDSGVSCRCDARGSLSTRCDARGHCQCKPNVEGPDCSSCRSHHFHLSSENQEGCLPCFCMGVTQLCTSTSYYRDLVTSPFLPGNFQNFALTNRQHSTRISTGFTVEMSNEGPQLSYGQFGQLGHDSYYWQLPESYQGDKRETYFARMRRAHKNETSLTEEQLRKDVAAGKIPDSVGFRARARRAAKGVDEEQKRIDSAVWNLLSSFRSQRPASSQTAPPPESTHPLRGGPAPRKPPPGGPPAPPPPPPPHPALAASARSAAGSSSLPPSLSGAPGYVSRISDVQAPSRNAPRPQSESSNLLFSSRDARVHSAEKYSLVYKGFSLLPESVFYWQLPEAFLGDKVAAYGGRLRYTLSYNAGARGSALPDADVQITGNDIMLVAYQPELRPRERKNFEIIFREQYWKRPDGQPATREHLMMVLADLDEILIRATYSTDMVSASITGVSMETAVPQYTSLPRALEVEECQCPPGYTGLSCQDCAPGYTRTGGGLYLGHCEMCECNGHSDSCHPETGACSNCLHNTVGEFCEHCAPGFYGDASAGTPEDCQPCACPLTDVENQFSRTCESLGTGGYRCTACQPGYTGQYCERCAQGYVGNPNIRGQKCVPGDRAPLVVQVYPQRTTISQGGEVSLRCQVSGNPPYYFYWSREDGRSISSNAQQRAKGEELHFPIIQASDAGVYICTCRNLQNSNTSRAEIIVTAEDSKPITVTVEEKKEQNVHVGADVTFVCTAKSKSPAYTLVWTRLNNGKLPERAMDFNGILTIRGVQLEDAGVYVCTGSNMFDMDEGTATLYVQEPTKTQMFYGPYETFEGHRPSATAVQPTATIEPQQLAVQEGQIAEFRCIATGNPPPTLEWTGGPNGVISPKAIIQGGVLRFPAVELTDEAQYSCRVRNSAGHHLARAVLRVHRGSLPEVQVSPERTEVQEGDTVRLYCRGGGSPAATISWKKEGGSLPSQALSAFGFLHFRSSSLEALQRRVQELQSRTERTDISTLVIPSISAADGGVYLCVGTSSSGTAEARIEVTVIKAAGIVSPVRIESSLDSVTEGQTVDLNCIVAGHLQPTVRWYKWYRPGRSLPPNHQVSGSRLRIAHASLADAGEYVCQVGSDSGIQQASVVVSVAHHTHPGHPPGITPTIRIEPSASSVMEGQTIELNCVTAGHAQPTVTWYRPGGTLSANHQVSGSRLRIIKASSADSGEYICRASSGSGVLQASITISIGDTHSSGVSPPVRIESSSNAVTEGQTVELNCVVAGHSRPPVTWYRRGGALSPNHQVSGSRLRILQATSADSGEYVCRVSDGAGTHEGSITISVISSASPSDVAPPVRIESSSNAVTEGQTIELNCVVAGHSRPMVTWYRRGSALSPNHQVSGSQLRILQATSADSGEYLCRVSSGAGTHEGSITISVTSSASPSGIAPPVRIESSSNSVTEGQTIDLNCVAAGQSRPTITWYRRGSALSPNHQVSGSRLRIVQATSADSGEYVCRISSGAGTHEGSITISVTSSASPSDVAPPVRIESSSNSVTEGQTIELNCVVAGHSRPTVTWYRRGSALSPNHQVSGSRLRIVQATSADSGEYVCRVSSGAGTHEGSITISVTSSASPSDVAPPVRIESSSNSVTEGQAIELNCVVAGQSRPTVTWYRRRDALSPNHQVSGSRLRILQATSADSGDYVCRVSDGAGTYEGSITISVTGSALPSPLVRIEASSHSITEGQTVELNCVVSGHPRPTVTWHRTGGTLSSNHQVSGSRLRILRFSPEDSGEYVCRAGTGSGTHEASIVISITTNPGSSYRLQSPIISIDPHSAVVRHGENATFKCRIHDGAQPIRIEWKMAHNQPLQENVKISPNGSVITIVGARHNNQGAYRCVASNPYGIAHSIVNLMVQGAPLLSVLPKGPVRVKVGQNLNLECMGTGDPRPVVSWRRTGVLQKIHQQSPLHLDSHAVLQIPSVKPEDAGTYTCVGQNPVGSAQVQVEVHVESNVARPGAPQVTVEEPVVVAVTGTSVILRCSASGHPTPTIKWSKLRAPLPWQHQLVNDTLIIPNVGQQDSGQYICNASNTAGYNEVFITLDVETPPYATSLPDELSVGVGEAVQLQCLAHGTPPLRFQWTKVNGSLSNRASIREGVLHINPATQEDEGRYRCSVSNKVGTGEALAHVHVLGASLAVRVSPQIDVKGVSGTAEFTCSIIGGSQARIEWFKEGGQLPPHHSVQDGVLRIQNLDRGSQGIYTCRATSPFGQAQDSAKLVIQALPRVMINIRTSVQTVLAGNAVEFECLAIGDPQARVTWSKVGSRLPPDVVISGGMLKIEEVKQSDAGQYRCTATNDMGTVQSHIILHVQSIPQIAAQPEVKEVATGSSVVFPCLASGFPVPEISWTKLEGDLPRDARLEGNILTIPSVRPQDAGTYVCTAINRQGKVTAFSMLKVRERVVPYFTDSPRSHLKLPTIKDAYKKFEVRITFRPDTADALVLYSGMLVYNGQKNSTGADFISFGLVGGRPEVRFDAGSGMATIRYPNPIKLGEFHTVTIYRNLTQGSLVVDDQPPVNGTSQGKFQGLDLNEELYLGGYPNYDAISKTGLRNGFVGCVRQLIIQGEEVIFKDLDLHAQGISNCPTCRDRPCQNRGVCQDSESSSYVCICPQGFTGSNCEHFQAFHCHPEACGPNATCINREDGLGYNCRCHLGKAGDKCMEGIMVTTPFFSGDDSFVAYPPLTNIHYELRVDMEFKPLSPSGLLFFSGGKVGPMVDFVSLAMVDGHVEFRYELGSGLAILKSASPLALGQWHKVSAERVNKDGSLQVDSSKAEKRSSPGKSQGLNLRTLMYLGGVDQSTELPAAVNLTDRFHGCIGEVSVNGKKVDISYSFTDSYGIGQCQDRSPCDRMPCQHGGRCRPGGEDSFQCLCREGFKGARCELAENECLLHYPCLNGGTCKGRHCLCRSGFSGTYCEQDAPGQYGAYFSDGAYIALPRQMFPRSHPTAPETIELEIRTTSSNGIILWQGVEEKENGKAKDFISIGLQDGHLVFSYQLGSGEANIISEDPINDGEWHKVTAVREGKVGSIQVDGEDTVSGQSPGNNVMVNTKGHIYLGGAPQVKTLTARKYLSGITGCLKNVILMNSRLGHEPHQPIDLKHHAEAGHNIKECPS